ncbi:MAG: M23 family metallopeptidase [Treponema sp.]|nr:M23 family metallopeptidase [Treponema sp.]
MKNKFFLLLAFLQAAFLLTVPMVFAGGVNDDPVEVSIPPEPPAPPAETGPCFAVIPSRVTPGEPVTIAYTDDFTGPGSTDFTAVLFNSAGKSLLKAGLWNFTKTAGGREVKAGILAVPATVNSGPYFIRIQAVNRTVIDLPLVVEKRDFVSEVIDLNEENTNLRTVPDPQKTAESDKLWAILSHTGTEIFDGGRFTQPVSTERRTSFYGDRRVYKYIDNTTDTAIHAGIDFGVPTGTEVHACAAGRVVLAAFRIVTGNSVVLEHLPGVYSIYYHMDRIAVKAGDIISSGTVLGYSGSTGLATGPHLHWEIRVATEYADPDIFMARAVLDKDEILRNLVSY